MTVLMTALPFSMTWGPVLLTTVMLEKATKDALSLEGCVIVIGCTRAHSNELGHQLTAKLLEVPGTQILSRGCSGGDILFNSASKKEGEIWVVTDYSTFFGKEETWVTSEYLQKKVRGRKLASLFLLSGSSGWRRGCPQPPPKTRYELLLGT